MAFCDFSHQQLSDLESQIAHCHVCVDHGYLAHANPVAGARGQLTNRIMLIGQAPGRLSVERHMPFGGPGGIVLEQWFVRAGFEPQTMRSLVYMTALTRCFPGSHPTGKGDRAPSLAEQRLCRSWLDAEFALINPELVLLIGKMAIDTFLGRQQLEAVVGHMILLDGRTWLPLPHPSGVSRWLNDPDHQQLLADGLDALSHWREQHLTILTVPTE